MRTVSPEQFLKDITVRLACKYASGTEGTGTSFVFTFYIDGIGWVPTLVTNRHVLEDAKEVTAHFNVTDIGSGEQSILEAIIELTPDNTLGHPDADCDLQLLYLRPISDQLEHWGMKIRSSHLKMEHIPSDEKFKELLSAEEILMIGYPIGLRDSENNRALFRRGITATEPGLDYDGKQEFLVDIACFPGSSGSPVFLYRRAMPVGRGLRGGEARFGFLGILWGGPRFTASGNVVPSPIPMVNTKNVALTKLTTNLGYVIRATRLKEFLYPMKRQIEINERRID